MSEEDSIIEGTPVKSDPKLELPFTPSKIISGSFYQNQPNKTFVRSEEKVNRIPVRKFQPAAVPDSRRPNRCNLMTSPNANFKIPITPVRAKLANSTTPKSSSSHLKNVVSPVALYIKNSPNFPLKQNVPQRELSKITITKNPKSSSKENLIDLPETVYKPAKKQIISKEKEITLPSSCKGLIKEQVIVKHEGRINHKSHKTGVNRKLLHDDVTNNSIDASILNNSSDISVLTNKQAYIK